MITSRAPFGARRLAAAAALIGGALAFASSAPAVAQAPGSYDVPPSDLAVVERQLQSILDYTAPQNSVQFPTPSGASASVDPDLPIDRFTGAQCIGCTDPCRSYRINIITPDRTREIVMEGFRCRQSQSGLWVMRQPERVIAERPLAPETPEATAATDGAGGPLVLGEERAPLADRAAGDPRFAIDPAPTDGTALGEAAAPGAGPTDLRARLEGVLGEGGDLRLEGETLPPQHTADAAPQTEAPPAAEGPAPDQAATTPTPPVDTIPAGTIPPRPQGDDAPAGRELASLPESEQARRIIYPGPGAGSVEAEAAATDFDGFANDPEIVGALRRLYYLPGRPEDGPADPAAVGEAIEAFARDERFAIPVEHAALAVYLKSAIERIDQVASCDVASADDGPFTACIESEAID